MAKLEKQRRGPKPLHDVPMVRYSLHFTVKQAAYLDTQLNASQTVRDALDAWMEKKKAQEKYYCKYVSLA